MGNSDQSPRVGPYILKGVLGRGAYGKVKLAVKDGTGEQFACKILNKSLVREKSMADNIQREVAIMRYLRHVNTVSLIAVYATRSKIFIVMELVLGGELLHEVMFHYRLSEPYSRFFFHQLIDGLEHCHSIGVYHRDLKPENILIDGDLTLKITDFGLSVLREPEPGLDPSSSVHLSTQCGTPCYSAPEMILLPGGSYSGARVDMWACGVILYVMASGTLPFAAGETDDLFKLIVTGTYESPDHFSEELQDLIRNLLKTNPLDRFTIAQVRQHPWFNGPKEDHMPGCLPGIAPGPSRDSDDDSSPYQHFQRSRPPSTEVAKSCKIAIPAPHRDCNDIALEIKDASQISSITKSAVPTDENCRSKDSLDVKIQAQVLTSDMVKRRARAELNSASAFDSSHLGHSVPYGCNTLDSFHDSLNASETGSASSASIEDNLSLNGTGMSVSGEMYESETEYDEFDDELSSEAPGEELVLPTAQPHPHPSSDVVADVVDDMPVSGGIAESVPVLADCSTQRTSAMAPDATPPIETPVVHLSSRPSDTTEHEMTNGAVARQTLQNGDEPEYHCYTMGVSNEAAPAISKLPMGPSAATPSVLRSMPELRSKHARPIHDNVRMVERSNDVALSPVAESSRAAAASTSSGQGGSSSSPLRTRSVSDHMRIREELYNELHVVSSDEDYDDVVEVAIFASPMPVESGNCSRNANGGPAAVTRSWLSLGDSDIALQNGERVPEQCAPGVPEHVVEAKVTQPATLIAMPERTPKPAIFVQQPESPRAFEEDKSSDDPFPIAQRTEKNLSFSIGETSRTHVGLKSTAKEPHGSPQLGTGTPFNPVLMKGAMPNDKVMSSCSEDIEDAAELGFPGEVIPVGSRDLIRNVGGRCENGIRRVRSLGDSFMEVQDASFEDHAMTRYHSEYCNNPHESMHAVDVQRRLWHRDAVSYRVSTENIGIGRPKPDDAAVDVFRMEKMADDVDQACRAIRKALDRSKVLMSKTRNEIGAAVDSTRYRLLGGNLVRSQTHDGSMTVEATRRRPRPVSRKFDPVSRRPMRHASETTNSSEVSSVGRTNDGQSRRRPRSPQQSLRAGRNRGSVRRSRHAEVNVRVHGSERTKFVNDEDWVSTGPNRRVWCLFLKEINTIPDELEFGMTSEELDEGWKAKLAEENLAPTMSFSERYLSSLQYESPMVPCGELRKGRGAAYKYRESRDRRSSSSPFDNEGAPSVSAGQKTGSVGHELDDRASPRNEQDRQGQDGVMPMPSSAGPSKYRNSNDLEAGVTRRPRSSRRVSHFDGSCTDGSWATGEGSSSSHTQDVKTRDGSLRESTCAAPEHERTENRKVIGNRQAIPVVGGVHGEEVGQRSSIDSKEIGSDELGSRKVSSPTSSEDGTRHAGLRSGATAIIKKASDQGRTLDGVDNNAKRAKNNVREGDGDSVAADAGTSEGRASMGLSSRSGQNNTSTLEVAKHGSSDADDGGRRIVERDERYEYRMIDRVFARVPASGAPEGMTGYHANLVSPGRKKSVNPFEMDIPAPRGYPRPSGHVLLRLPHAVEMKMQKKLRGFWHRRAGGRHEFRSAHEPSFCLKVMREVIDGCDDANVLRVNGHDSTPKMHCDMRVKNGVMQFTVLIFPVDYEMGPEVWSIIEFRRRRGNGDEDDLSSLYSKLRDVFRSKANNRLD